MFAQGAQAPRGKTAMKREIALVAACGAVLAGSVAWAAVQPDVAARAERAPEAAARAEPPRAAGHAAEAKIAVVRVSMAPETAALSRPVDRVAAAPLAGDAAFAEASPAAAAVQSPPQDTGPSVGTKQVILIAAGGLAAAALLSGGDGGDSD